MTSFSSRLNLALLMTLLVISVPPRVLSLGGLSFYADEETTAFPIAALAEGKGAILPSGMEYRRALPYTWSAVVLARAFGARNEWVHRLPAAIAGILSVPVLFLLGRMMVGPGPAWIAALLLAFSEWHLVFSRQARMYAPFLFVYLIAAYFTWRWVTEGRKRDLVGASASLALCMTMHKLGLFAVQFAVLPLLISVPLKTRYRAAFALFGVAALGGWAYDEFFVSAPYDAWLRPAEALGAPPATVGSPSLSQPLVPLAWVGGVLGAVLGLWAAWAVRHRRRDSGGNSSVEIEPTAPTRILHAVPLACVVIAGAMLGGGALFGAAAFLWIGLVLRAGSLRELLESAWVPLLVATGMGVAWAVLTLVAMGTGPGIRALVSFPNPQLLRLGLDFPVVSLLFAFSAMAVAVRRKKPTDSGLRGVVLAAVLPPLAVGFVSEEEATRYLMMVYPFLLLGAGATVWWAVHALAGRFSKGRSRLARPLAAAMATVVAVSGVVGKHGVSAAARVVSLEHGQPVDPGLHMFPFRPDHAGAGIFVSSVRGRTDIVIAEDPLQQAWYLQGDVDYWFRSPWDAGPFLYVAEDGTLRDIYVSSVYLEDLDHLERVVSSARGRVWFISSGETSSLLSWYLSPEQIGWWEGIQGRLTPAFVARDGVTSVYCVNCPRGSLEPTVRPAS